MNKSKIEIKMIDWFDDHFYKVRYENEKKVEVEDYLPSVTTKLGALAKPHLLRWYGDIGTREAIERMREKADRGTRIHHAWYYYTTGGVVIYNPPKAPLYSDEEIKKIKERYNNQFYILYDQEEMFQLMKLENFCKAIKPEKITSEITVCDIDNRDAGTTDNIIYNVKEGSYAINGSKELKLPQGDYIIDLKTGTTVDKSAYMQISCYFKCVLKMGLSDNLKGALILHTSSKNKSGIEGLSTKYLSIDDIEEHYQDYRDIARVWERNFGNRKPTIRQVPGYLAMEA